MIEQKWDKIGEVVDGPEESNCPFHDGIQYDYVFDVDIGDGMPICKLPYNRSGKHSESLMYFHHSLTHRRSCATHHLHLLPELGCPPCSRFSSPPSARLMMVVDVAELRNTRLLAAGGLHVKPTIGRFCS